LQENKKINKRHNLNKKKRNEKKSLPVLTKNNKLRYNNIC